MREHWIDSTGRKWCVAPAGKRLNLANKGPQALRSEVFRRDGFTCVKCGWKPESIPEHYDGRYTVIGGDVRGKRRELQLDHIHPINKGGSNHPSNFQTLCFGCNAAKRNH